MNYRGEPGLERMRDIKLTILCLNSGSSSLKFALYEIGDTEEALLVKGAVERIGLQSGHVWIRTSGHELLKDGQDIFPDHGAAIRSAFGIFEELDLPLPVAVGHRIVHGGPDHSSPALVDTGLRDVLRKFIPFAPLHLPSEILCIDAIADRFPDLPQVACFDTAFHRRIPEVAQRFPLPRDLFDEGLRRYGFHGLSYEFIIGALGQEAENRVIIAHLGNGASMAAVRNGQPLDTTMGFTPTGGFMMGTRSGDLDPGILIFLINEKGYNAEKIDRLVNEQSGLIGVSGISSDMKTLLEKMNSDSRAADAVEMYCYHLRKSIASLTAVLNGLDVLVFTGGIGERAAAVRSRVCRGLWFLGIDIDDKKNNKNANIISSSKSNCIVRVIPTNEDLMIARHTYGLVAKN
jgi:acetate kinase